MSIDDLIEVFKTLPKDKWASINLCKVGIQVTVHTKEWKPTIREHVRVVAQKPLDHEAWPVWYPNMDLKLNAVGWISYLDTSKDRIDVAFADGCCHCFKRSWLIPME